MKTITLMMKSIEIDISNNNNIIINNEIKSNDNNDEDAIKININNTFDCNNIN